MTTQWRDQCSIDGVAFYIGDPTGELPTLTGTAKLVEEKPKTQISACWRGYVADWRVESGHLYLDAVDDRFRPVEPLPVLADWVTGSFDLSREDGSGDYVLKVTKGAVYGLVTRIAEDLLAADRWPAPIPIPIPELSPAPPATYVVLVEPNKRSNFTRWMDKALCRLTDSWATRTWEDKTRG